MELILIVLVHALLGVAPQPELPRRAVPDEHQPAGQQHAADGVDELEKLGINEEGDPEAVPAVAIPRRMCADGKVKALAPQLDARDIAELEGSSPRDHNSGQLQLEGCVVDDEAGTIFIGEEEHGIWKLDLADSTSTPEIVDTIAAANGLGRILGCFAVYSE
mgnify:CR=1 FL=1